MRLRLTRSIALAAAILAAGTISARQEQTTRRIPQFENDEVRVWKSVIVPNQPLSMHRHDHPRVIVALRGGSLKIVAASGESRTEVWETGKAYWLGADRPDELHGDVNEGADPIEVMVIELKKSGS